MHEVCTHGLKAISCIVDAYQPARTVQGQKNEIVMKCRILNILMAANQPYQDSAALKIN